MHGTRGDGYCYITHDSRVVLAWMVWRFTRKTYLSDPQDHPSCQRGLAQIHNSWG
jgi:hypothetical protein